MINTYELSILRTFKYIHLSDRTGMGKVNLDGKWIKYYNGIYYQVINFDDYVLNSHTVIYGDDNIICQDDGTLFISERAKEKFNTNGDIVGYLFNIESRWIKIKREGDKKLPYNIWRKELNHFVLFVMYCVLTLIGATKTLLVGLFSSIVVGIGIWIIGDIILYYRNKDYVREYIKEHEYDDYSKILIQEYLSDDNDSIAELIKKIFYIGI